MVLELLWRGYTHWTMGILGGICFVAVGEINEGISWRMPLFLQMIIGGNIITLLEFISGCFLNIHLKLNIWDYSNLPFNYLGQISLFSSLGWIGLSLIAIILDDYLRYFFFGEEKPHYRIFKWS